MSTTKHTIYVINTSESGKSYWNRAGVAFENKDGSFTLKLDILPQTKFQLREETPSLKGEAAREQPTRRQPGRPALVAARAHRNPGANAASLFGLPVKRAIVFKRHPDDRAATSGRTKNVKNYV